MTLTVDHLRRIIQVSYACDLGFVELVGLAELDSTRVFRGVVARNIDMRRQDLAGFDFTGATFIGCDLRGADLSRTIGVTHEMLEASLIDETTQLPLPRDGTFWASGQPPTWAEDWGLDSYGPWVSFRVPRNDAMQRMRWIVPGRFMMGSPDTEEDRLENEGPVHLVTIEKGFWIFETACSEGLWAAVMGKPQRRQRRPSFPVIDVSWNDARSFVRRLNEIQPGLALCLPSESKWEYACRAGTRTPYSFGTSISQEQVCFESNSPVAVGSLPPNRWGLREMHGNVWEWCEDNWHPGFMGAPDDGTEWVGGGAQGRVVRGGSWLYKARNVRAACRCGYDPSGHDGNVGFRCVRDHLPRDADPAEPAALVTKR